MKTLILVSLFTSLSAFAVCPELKVPLKFQAVEKITLIGTDMSLMEGSKKFGTIKEQVLNFSPTFNLYNTKNEKIGSAKTRIISWGTTTDIKDCQGTLIGTVKEKIFSSLLSVKSSYEILDAAGRVIYNSDKTEILNTKFVIKDTSGAVQMTMTRPTFNLITDKWTIEGKTGSKIDPLLVIMIPALKTSADNRREKEKDNK